jgi:hypothetical protein
MNADAAFSPTYAIARQRFRAATAHLSHGALDVVDGLTIDWAYHGDPDAEDLVVFTSGLHGVEGFPGSAVQLALLLGSPTVSTLFVHALNPWGMANFRRVNESNVDLNRNFLPPGTPYQGIDEGYRRLSPLLNPSGPPRRWEAFWPRVGLELARYGLPALRNAIARGQYEEPRGLFYGGAELQRGPTVFLPFVEEHLGWRRRVVHVDLHSGLGKFGDRTLILEGKAPPAQRRRAQLAFGPGVRAWDPGDTTTYEIIGGVCSEVQRRLPQVRYDALTCEFGTVSNLEIIAALRDENRVWFEAGGDRTHPAVRRLVHAYHRPEPAWRSAVLGHARTLFDAAAAMLRSD